MLRNRAVFYLIAIIWILTVIMAPACAPVRPAAAWQKMDSGTTDYLLSVWGNSDKDVFTVGFNGAILHYDGKVWARMFSGTEGWLLGIWGSSPSNVIAAGQKGCLLNYDGTSWNPVDSGASLDLWGCWGTSGADVYVSRQDGAVLHYDGNRWDTLNQPSRRFYVTPGVPLKVKC
jgi:hypothetical protein